MESDALQFILETPQNHVGTKKRPRLVTSCDNCRLKKIKCNQSAPEAKCEACKASRISCRFRDRERYFAERSRAIAGPNSGVYATELKQQPQDASPPLAAAYTISSGSSSPSAPRSSSDSPRASGMVSAEADMSSRYQAPYSPNPRMGGSHHAQSSSISSFDSMRSNSNVPYNAYAPQSLNQPNYSPTNGRHINSYSQVTNARLLAYFDHEDGQRPRRDLMPHFIQVFFEQHPGEFPFLTHQETIADFYNNRLTPILANAIAAMAVQHTNLGELSARDLLNLAESYTEAARTAYTAIAQIPSIETLHGLMLISWFEQQRGRSTAFQTYYSVSAKMAQDLGLQDHSTLELYNDYEKSRRRTTWAGVLQLHSIYSRLR
ncbi:hypothetical protein D9619_001725 [Psilocybe cf. subviscida]|uniref:Zn(2)-C6 fungal-type domain-containing protein n=1 Tax=Psilocybe cf. subviscida TaxID=2480587 RepID=A0A8H5F2X7_9AGAR|nr:hypothetical protein D9619_001725 [Psilocybe cf. subviscida]